MRSYLLEYWTGIWRISFKKNVSPTCNISVSILQRFIFYLTNDRSLRQRSAVQTTISYLPTTLSRLLLIVRMIVNCDVDLDIDLQTSFSSFHLKPHAWNACGGAPGTSIVLAQPQRLETAQRATFKCVALLSA